MIKRKKRGKKIPWSKLKGISNRFNDVRFDGIEDAIVAMGDKDKKQSIYGGTGFYVQKNKKPNFYQSDENFQDAYNNYEEDAEYTGKAYLRMYREHRGKKHHYLITIEDLPESSNY